MMKLQNRLAILEFFFSGVEFYSRSRLILFAEYLGLFAEYRSLFAEAAFGQKKSRSANATGFTYSLLYV